MSKYFVSNVIYLSYLDLSIKSSQLGQNDKVISNQEKIHALTLSKKSVKHS